MKFINYTNDGTSISIFSNAVPEAEPSSMND
jgi:hypothetical protein